MAAPGWEVFVRGGAIGIGARSAVDRSDILKAVRKVFGGSSFHCLASIDRRVREPGMIAAAAELEVPLLGFGAVELARVEVPNPAERIVEALGTASVAEAAAVLACRGFGGAPMIVVPKTVVGPVTVAVAVPERR